MQSLSDIKTGGGIWSRLGAGLAPALLLVFSTLYFLPYTIYRGNVEEFTVSLSSILASFHLPAIILIVILCAVATLLPKALRARYISLIFILGVLVWLQGGIIVWDYGELTGEAIDWSAYAWRGIADSLLWLVLIAIALIFAKNIRQRATLVSFALVALQIFFVVSTSLQDPLAWGNEKIKSSDAEVRENIFSFSKEKNVIHVILDQFQSDIFKLVIDEEPERYYNALSGFTFFADTSASFPATLLSIPAIVSGRTYKNDKSIKDFIEEVLTGETIFSAMDSNGYEVDRVHATGAYRDTPDTTNHYRIPFPYGLPENEQARANTAQLLDLALFRAAPHYLKRSVYRDQTWLLQRHFATGFGMPDVTEKDKSTFQSFSSRAFLKDLSANLRVSRKKPVYKFIHLVESHGPLVFNDECRYAGKILEENIPNERTQLKCSLDNFLELIAKLKEAGIYDSSLIVVNADHGTSAGLVDMDGAGLPFFAERSAAMPLLMIKAPNEKGPLKVSNAPATLTDIPDTISSLAGLSASFGHRSVTELKENEARVRRYHSYFPYNSKKYFKRIDEHIIKGNVKDVSSWRLGRSYHPPGADYRTSRIDFGTKSARYYQLQGWSPVAKDPASSKTFNMNTSREVSLLVTLPKNKSSVITINMAIFNRTEPAVVTMVVDGKKAATVTMKDPGALKQYKFPVPPDKDRPDISSIDLLLTPRDGVNAVEPHQVILESLAIGAL